MGGKPLDSTIICLGAEEKAHECTHEWPNSSTDSKRNIQKAEEWEGTGDGKEKHSDSLDPALRDCWLLPKVKMTIRGKRLELIQDMEAATTAQLDTVRKEDSRAAAESSRHDKKESIMAMFNRYSEMYFYMEKSDDFSCYFCEIDL
ncbi:hypothetical protein H920_15197 [Fukomys damarensis]|uniref:Uncharacterized protein n=1 Tax=Fukomys damarensis TaxID=885580 RepID=A0A091CXI9_FUKDA|nr:hypothetical protein H920_15197 [Fukomys damarensis]